MSKLAVYITHTQEPVDLTKALLGAQDYQTLVLKVPHLVPAGQDFATSEYAYNGIEPYLGLLKGVEECFNTHTPDLVLYEANLGFPNKSVFDVLDYLWNFKPKNIDGVKSNMEKTLGDLARHVEDSTAISPKFGEGKTAWIAYANDNDVLIDLRSKEDYKNKIATVDKAKLSNFQELPVLLKYL